MKATVGTNRWSVIVTALRAGKRIHAVVSVGTLYVGIMAKTIRKGTTGEFSLRKSAFAKRSSVLIFTTRSGISGTVGPSRIDHFSFRIHD